MIEYSADIDIVTCIYLCRNRLQAHHPTPYVRDTFFPQSLRVQQVDHKLVCLRDYEVFDSCISRETASERARYGRRGVECANNSHCWSSSTLFVSPRTA